MRALHKRQAIMIQHNRLRDRVIIVTGAGQGIGRAAALAFAGQGATVILVGRKTSKLEQVYDAITAQHLPQPAIFAMDLALAKEADFQALAEAIFKEFKRLDGILHNAARFDNLSPLAIHTAEQMEGMFRVNVLAPFLLTKACLPLLQAAPDASVVFTSTEAAHSPAAYWGAHAVTKSAQQTLASIWADETGVTPHLRFNVVIPGALQTPQRRKSHPGEAPDSRPAPEAVMPLYIHLMSQDSAGVNGQVFEALKYSQGAA